MVPAATEREQPQHELSKIIPSTVLNEIFSAISYRAYSIDPKIPEKVMQWVKLSNDELLKLLAKKESLPNDVDATGMSILHVWLVLAFSHPKLSDGQLIELLSSFHRNQHLTYWRDLLEGAARFGRDTLYKEVLRQWKEVPAPGNLPRDSNWPSVKDMRGASFVTLIKHGHIESAKSILNDEYGPQILQEAMEFALQYSLKDAASAVFFIAKEMEANNKLKGLLSSKEEQKLIAIMLCAISSGHAELVQLLFKNLIEPCQKGLVTRIVDAPYYITEHIASGNLGMVRWLLENMDSTNKEVLFSNSSKLKLLWGNIDSSLIDKVYSGRGSFDVMELLIKGIISHNKDKDLLTKKFDEYHQKYQEKATKYTSNYLIPLYHLLFNDAAVLAYAKANPKYNGVIQTLEAYRNFMTLLEPLKERINTHLKKCSKAGQEAEAMIKKLIDAAHVFYTQPATTDSLKGFKAACEAAYAKDQYPELRKHPNFLAKVVVIIKNFFNALKERVCGTTPRTYVSFWDSRPQSEVIVDRLKGQVEGKLAALSPP